jgi:hypothetical protein
MSNPYQSPSQIPGSNFPQYPGQGDATGGVIPYKNPKALMSYYCGFLSLLCCFGGLPVGLVAIVLGIMGLMDKSKNPHIKGSAHAVVGIVLGVISLIGSIFFGSMWLMALLSAR